MSEMQTVWRLNIPESLGLFEAGLDDLGVDAEGNVYVGDGVNGAVYRFRPTGEMDKTFDVIRPVALNGQESGLNLAVVADSSLCVADPGNNRIVRYDSLGQAVGEFTAPGLLALCCAPGGHIYALASDDDGERIDCYDVIGSRIEALCAPRRHRRHLDPDLVKIDADAHGRAYVSYGMPPYRVWRVSRTQVVESDPSLSLGREFNSLPSNDECSAELETWRRELDHPEDVVLIADLGYEPVNSVLWVLLASRESGRQTLDAFSSAGEFLGSVALPHSDNLYSSVCSTGDEGLYLLDGAAGDLIRVTIPSVL